MQVIPASDLWIQDLDRDIRRRLTFGPEDEDAPVFSAGGERVFFTAHSNSSGARYSLSEVATDAAGPPRVLLKAGEDVWPTDCSPDGRYLLVTVGDFNASVLGRAIATFSLDGSARVDTLLSGGEIGSARFSPDGRWIAYASDESGASQVFVMPFAPSRASGRWQASLAGGGSPRWRGDGRALYVLRDDGTLVTVDLDASGGVPRIGAERTLFRVTVRQQTESLEVLGDGSSFVVNTLSGDWSTPIVLVSDWLAQLRKP
jgi:Tol biopolymer transport system component